LLQVGKLERAACVGAHGDEPAEPEALATMDQAGQLFAAQATELWERCRDEHLEPLELIGAHQEFGPFVTYSVRCSRLSEILGLLGLWRGQYDDSDDDVTEWLERFLVGQPGVAHPLSDRYAVSLIAPAVLLRPGREALLTRWLRETVRWVADRYDGELLGLADPDAGPEAEVEYALSALEHVERPRRRESYLAAVVLDLASALELGDLYDDARHEFLAVGVHPELLHSPDTVDQYRRDGARIEQEVNPPYIERWTPADGWRTAPHHTELPESRWLLRIGRPWEQLALSSVLRDRHFISAIRVLAATEPDASNT
jgi:hypothetical protein